MSLIETNTTYFPIVIITFFGSDSESVAKGCADSDALIAQGVPWVVIRDIRFLLDPPGAVQRKMAADWTLRVRDDLSRLCLGAATVMESPMLRGALRAVHWLATPPMPEHVVSTFPEALDWCLAKLEAAGVAPPTNLPELMARDLSAPI